MVQSLRISNQATITIDLNEDENGRLLERLARRWWQMTSMKVDICLQPFQLYFKTFVLTIIKRSFASIFQSTFDRRFVRRELVFTVCRIATVGDDSFSRSLNSYSCEEFN